MMDFAFPQPHEWTTGGLTKREYFAAKAMQGMCANAGLFAAFQEPRKLGLQGGLTASDMDTIEHKAIAQVSLAFADALIAELNKGEKP